MEGPDGLVPAVSSRELALLLFLAWHAGKRIARDDLIALFWNYADRRTRHSFSQVLWRTRHTLPTLPIETVGSTVRLPPDVVSVDARLLLFAASTDDWQGVLRRYSGPFLSDFKTVGDGGFEQWRDRICADVAWAVIRAYEATVASAMNEGNWLQVINLSAKVRDIHPHPGEMTKLVAFATAALGEERKAARSSITSPGFLARSKAAHAVSLRRITDRYPVSTPASPAGVELYVPFVGRADAFAQLKDCLDGSSRGELRIALIEGHSGIGKSRLASHFLRFAALRGACVILGSGRRNWEDVPYGLLGDLLRSCSMPSALQDAPAPLQRVLARLLPEYASPEDDAPTYPDHDRDHAGVVVEALTYVLGYHADRRPLVLCVDHLEWVDDLSMQQLARSIERLRDRRVMLVLCWRPDESLTDTSANAFAQVSADRAASTISLSELSKSEVWDLFSAFGDRRGVSIGDATRRQLYGIAGGHPFFLIELLRQCFENSEGSQPAARQIPPSIQTAIRWRLEQLSASSRHLLELLAVVGQPVSKEVVLAFGRALSIVDPEASLETLGDRGLVVGRADVVRLAQDILGDVIVAAMSNRRTRTLHGLAASVMATMGSFPDALVGSHYERASMSDVAARYYASAAVDALATDACTAAERFARFAVDFGDADVRRTAQQTLFGVLFITRRYADAWRLVSEAVDGCALTLDGSGLVVDVPTLSLLAEIAEPGVPVESLLERIGTLLAQQDELNFGHAELLRIAAGAAVGLRDRDWWRSFVDRFTTKAIATKNDVIAALVLSACACVEAAFVSVREAEATARRAIERSRLSRRRFAEGRARAALGTVALLAGRLNVASHELDQARTISASLGLFGAAAAAANNLAVSWMEQGRLRAAIDLLEADAYALDAHDALVRLCNLSLAYRELGNRQSALRHAERSVAEGERLGQAWAVDNGRAVQGLIALDMGDTEVARRLCERVLIGLDGGGHPGTDSSYVFALVAECERLGLGDYGALQLLDSAIDTDSGKNILGAMRLRIARALLIAVKDPKGATRSLLDVIDQAERLDAVIIAGNARRSLHRLHSSTL